MDENGVSLFPNTITNHQRKLERFFCYLHSLLINKNGALSLFTILYWDMLTSVLRALLNNSF